MFSCKLFQIVEKASSGIIYDHVIQILRVRGIESCDMIVDVVLNENDYSSKGDVYQ